MMIKKHLIGLMKMKQGVEGLIQNTDELEFVIFCIESVAAQTKMEAEEVYDLLAKKTNILHEYIVPEFEILHTQSKEYIIDEIIDVLREKGVTI